MTWKAQAASIIAEVTRDLPADMPLKERKRIVDAARPYWGGCSWPRKAWQAARRDYLVRYGYEPKTKAAAVRRADVTEPPPLFAATAGRE